MTHPFFTIGHSTRSIEEFAAMLAASDVKLVVDVRTVPRSRTNPQFNRDVLPASLAERRIGYRHMASLGGLRGAQRDVPPASFHNYADYAMGDEFRAALEELRELGRPGPAAIMCAETLWWRCHRRIVADYLIAAGETVLHILSAERTEPAQLTRGARVGPDGVLTYPAAEAR